MAEKKKPAAKAAGDIGAAAAEIVDAIVPRKTAAKKAQKTATDAAGTGAEPVADPARGETFQTDASQVDASQVDPSHVKASPVDASPVDASPVDASPVDASPAVSLGGLPSLDPGLIASIVG